MDIEYLDSFEAKLEKELLSLCTANRMLDGVLLTSEDIDRQWKILAPEYVADAVKEVADYPAVSVSWAAYLGMAVATGWDADWRACQETPYTRYYGSEGFDNMDEHILQDVMGVDPGSREAAAINEMLLCCGEKTVGMIRHEQIEPQSILSFHVFARAAKAMFRTGASLQLYRLGYRFEKMEA